MPDKIITPEQARKMGTAILLKAGVGRAEAEFVADHLTESDLRGVGSHGLIRLVRYVEQIEAGHINLQGEITVIEDLPGLVRLDGGGGFGVVALGEATRRAIAKAKTSAVAAATVSNCSHTGRIGAFVEEAANAGCFALILGGGAHRVIPSVAPHGGGKGVFDTNPYALALPGDGAAPVVADFATSVISQGKLLLYRHAGKPVPEGWIVDADGNPSCDPEAYYKGGALLPAAGHKGYGLAVMAELIGHALLGEAHENNWLVIVLNLWGIRPEQDYKQGAAELLDIVRNCPPAKGFDEVLLPGDPEQRIYAERSRTGIPLPESTWTRISETAATLGVPLDEIMAG
jgi:LDH2 family malate/lactate/ureidoglycolate dehydrogenase